VEKDERTGKTAPRKVGLAPVMRDGVEYEFDVCGDLDQENTLVITKSRCSKLAGQVIQKPGSEMAAILSEWLGASQAKAGDPAPKAALRYWATRGEMKRLFATVREQLGERIYLTTLEKYSVRDAGEFRNIEDAVACYELLTEIARKEVA
jgi:hypothetical protein